MWLYQTKLPVYQFPLKIRWIYRIQLLHQRPSRCIPITPFIILLRCTTHLINIIFVLVSDAVVVATVGASFGDETSVTWRYRRDGEIFAAGYFFTYISTGGSGAGEIRVFKWDTHTAES